jgi:hypothetical protein
LANGPDDDADRAALDRVVQDEEILWEGRWNIGSWSTRQCWKTVINFALGHTAGLTESDVSIVVEEVALSQVIRDMFDGIDVDETVTPIGPGGPGPSGPGPVGPGPVGPGPSGPVGPGPVGPDPGVLTSSTTDDLNNGAIPVLEEGNSERGRIHIEERHKFGTEASDTWFVENGTQKAELTATLHAALPGAKGNWKDSPDRADPSIINSVADVKLAEQVGWKVVNRKTGNKKPLFGLRIVAGKNPATGKLDVITMIPIKK